jgi:cupin 2 domain-containing protein
MSSPPTAPTWGAFTRDVNPTTAGGGEAIEVVVSGPRIRVERIVSFGQASPEGFWYDQDEDEFVLLLTGAARLAFDDGRVLEMLPNDWVNIPAHVRHRVNWTSPTEATIWLATFTPPAKP